MINAKDKQDLIVHILAPGQRYEVANYKNVFIPTNLDVAPEAKKRFGEFYAALFDRTVEKNKGAVVTEYSWNASTCDPCPGPRLTYRDFNTLGADVLYKPSSTGSGTQSGGAGKPASGPPGRLGLRRPPPRGRVRRPPFRRRGGFVLTRLHARYGKGSIKDDLVFKEAKAVVGGRERRRGKELEKGASPSGINNFQARYAIRHEWTGPIECENPVRGRWGGPPRGMRRHRSRPTPAVNLAFAPRGKLKLASMVRQSVPEIGLAAPAKPAPDKTSGAGSGSAKDSKGADKKSKKKGCGCQSDSRGGAGALVLMLGAILFAVRRRR
jgi:MYXO-CTERM domain-containing protein